MGKAKTKAEVTPSPYGERLCKALQIAGYGDPKEPLGLRRDATAKLAAALDISFQAVRDALTGKTRQFAPDNSARAARFLKVDHYWLATGDGEPRPPGLSEEAIAFARRYDQLDVEGRAKFSAAIVLARSASPKDQAHGDQPVSPTRSQRQEDDQRHEEENGR